jgi:hypothetical protein
MYLLTDNATKGVVNSTSTRPRDYLLDVLTLALLVVDKVAIFGRWKMTDIQIIA